MATYVLRHKGCQVSFDICNKARVITFFYRYAVFVHTGEHTTSLHSST